MQYHAIILKQAPLTLAFATPYVCILSTTMLRLTLQLNSLVRVTRRVEQLYLFAEHIKNNTEVAFLKMNQLSRGMPDCKRV